jgi:hypothetical protein
MNYFFTFGQSHETIEGTPMKNFWVKVSADDYGSARFKFIEQFSSQFMPAPDKWAFQYEEKDFEPAYFPLGEYASIE